MYRKLIHYRKAHDSLTIGDYQALDAPHDVFAFIRQKGEEHHLLIFNFGENVQNVSLSGSGTIIMNTWLNRRGHFDGAIEVAANEGILIHLD